LNVSSRRLGAVASTRGCFLIAEAIGKNPF
jgi:hypothetical protein